jgi:hypothetical protein
MKKLTFMPRVVLPLLLGFSAISTTAAAANNNHPPLDKISFQLSAEQWAIAKTAKVTVRINAALTDSQLGTIHNDIMDNLKKIIDKVEWHITQFDRSKSQSGLEQLYAAAQARVPESELANLRQKAKAVSRPGESYQIDNIDFSPSQAEIQAVKTELRSNIYAQTKAELKRLDKEYPNEKFFLHNIEFNSGMEIPRPQIRTMVLAKTEADSSSSMAVSDKITLSANVILASNLHIKP